MGDFILGAVIGFLIGGVIAINSNDTIEKCYKQKTLCEETLPRNQVCEMKFVPKEY